ncbi:unnamed protein product [Boreogadus saida]
MEFDLEGFVGDPTIEKLDGCTVEHLKLIAGRYSVDVSGYVRKPVIKERLLSVLAEQGVLTAQGAVSPRKPGEVVFNEQVRMKELELELRRLELKEKEMTCHFEVRKLEEETKRVVRLKELELEIGVAVPSLSTGLCRKSSILEAITWSLSSRVDTALRSVRRSPVLKQLAGRDADPGLGSRRPAEPPVEEVADGAVKPGSACTLAVCSGGSVGVGIALETGEDDVEVPSKALVQGRCSRFVGVELRLLKAWPVLPKGSLSCWRLHALTRAAF